MSSLKKTFNIPPLTFFLDGAKVTILEVLDMSIDEKRKYYLVSCYIEYKNYRSKIFPLLVRDNKELIAKLRAEVAKMKLFVNVGETHMFDKIG